MIVVTKIGTSSITTASGDIDEAAVAKFCAEAAALRSLGHRVVLVTSGAIAAGLPALGYTDGDPCGACDNCVQRKADVGASTLRMKAYAPLKKGDPVRVPKYGRGTVEEVHDDRIVVAFPRGAPREFAPHYVEPVSSR